MVGVSRSIALWLMLLGAANSYGAEIARSTRMTNTWRNLTPGVSNLQDVKSSLGQPRREVSSVSRGGTSQLQLLDYPTPQSSIFLQNGVVLVIVIIPRDGDGFSLLEEEWEKALGAPPKKLPSVRGKNSWVYVYADEGIAMTVLAGKVRAIELFPPMTPEEYEARLYIRPPKFVK